MSVYASESLLTFDLGDDGASRSQDVHGVEGLVFADDGLEDAEELGQTLLHHLLKTFQIIYKQRGSTVSQPGEGMKASRP